MATEEISKDEKEALLNLRMEHIRRQNEALRKRYEEVEADKREAESHLFKERTSNRKVPEDRPGPRSRPSQKRTEDRAPPAFAAPERDRRRQQRLSENDGPPPDPSYSFLADRSREGNDSNQDRHQGSRRHPGNYGGQDFENVRSSIQRRRAQERARPQQPPRNKMEMTMRMTGRERWEYEQWLSERSRIEQDRINRQMTASGEWKREWDREKSYRTSRDDTKDISGGRAQWSSRGRGRGRGRSSWKESNDDWSQDSPHVRHDTSELHRPKDHPRETPSASPRQVQMKEDVINVSVSNHLVGRLGSQTGNEPESQTRERSRKERRDTQNNERQGKRKEQTSPRMIQVKVDSNSGTTEVQVATPERPVESHQHRKEGMQRHDEISVQPLQNNPESDSVVMMDTKSSALPSEGPSSGSSSVKQDLRPLDHHDEESWDDDGSWEDATTSGNESQENLEDIVNQYESDNEENIDAVTEEAETEKNQNDMTTTSLDSHPALTLAEQVTGSTQDPSDAPQDRQQTDSPIPTGSAESSGEENIRSVLEAKELERDDDDDREKTPQADDFCVDTIEEPSLMTETIQNSKTCLGDENSELECHSSEINDDREKTPQPDHLPLQDTVIVENSNNAPTAQSSGIDVEHLSETVQRIELLDGPEDEMGQAVDEKIKPTPIIEGSQLKTAVEVDATVSGNQTDSSNNENQCPNADEDFKNPSEAQDFSLQTKLELETLDQASNKVDEDLTMVTQRSELLEPLDGTETSLHQSSEPGDVCKQVPETDSSYITNTVELKDQSFEEHTVSQSVDECCDTTQDRLEKVEEDVAVQQPTVTNDNHQEASQAECTPLPGTTEQVTPDEDSDIVPVTERSESQDTTMHLAVEESELGSCQLCPEKEE